MREPMRRCARGDGTHLCLDRRSIDFPGAGGRKLQSGPGKTMTERTKDMKRAILKWCLMGAIATAGAAMTEPALAATGTIRVTSSDDNDILDGYCTPREAIIA